MNAYTRLILDNPEGGTVKLSGLDASLPGHGYFVGGVVSALIIDNPSEPTTEDIEAVDTFVSYLQGSDVRAEYLGWWTDEETGKLYVDGSTHFYSEHYARREGRNRGEIAIFDIVRKTSIYLDKE